MQVPKQFKYSMPPVLNQGNKPICVPCALSAFLNWNLNVRDGQSQKDNDIDLMAIFKGGGGTAEGMQFKKALGYLKNQKQIKEYGIIGSDLSLKSAILMNGPCVGGMKVRDNSRKDFWNGDSMLGGHAIAIIGWTEEGFLIRNSWGKNYGEYVVLPDFKQFTELWTLID